MGGTEDLIVKDSSLTVDSPEGTCLAGHCDRFKGTHLQLTATVGTNEADDDMDEVYESCTKMGHCVLEVAQAEPKYQVKADDADTYVPTTDDVYHVGGEPHATWLSTAITRQLEGAQNA